MVTRVRLSEVALDYLTVSDAIEAVLPAESRSARASTKYFNSVAQSPASFRSGEIRVLDSSGNVERTIAFNEADRKL